MSFDKFQAITSLDASLLPFIENETEWNDNPAEWPVSYEDTLADQLAQEADEWFDRFGSSDLPW